MLFILLQQPRGGNLIHAYKIMSVSLICHHYDDWQNFSFGFSVHVDFLETIFKFNSKFSDPIPFPQLVEFLAK